MSARARQLAHDLMDTLSNANRHLGNLPWEAHTLGKVVSGLHEPAPPSDRALAEVARGHADHANLSQWADRVATDRDSVEQLLDKLSHAVPAVHGPAGAAAQRVMHSAADLETAQRIYANALTHAAAVIDTGRPEAAQQAIHELRAADLGVRQAGELLKSDLDTLDHTHDQHDHHEHHRPHRENNDPPPPQPAPAREPQHPVAQPDPVPPGGKVTQPTDPAAALEGAMARLGKTVEDAAGHQAGQRAGEVLHTAGEFVGGIGEKVAGVSTDAEHVADAGRGVAEALSALGAANVNDGHQFSASENPSDVVQGLALQAGGSVEQAVGDAGAEFASGLQQIAHAGAQAGDWVHDRGKDLEGAGDGAAEYIRHAAVNHGATPDPGSIDGPGKPVIGSDHDDKGHAFGTNGHEAEPVTSNSGHEFSAVTDPVKGDHPEHESTPDGDAMDPS